MTKAKAPPSSGTPQSSAKARPRMRVVQAGGGSAPEPSGPRPHGPVTLFYNPKCSTSRKVLARLREVGLDPIVVDYLQTPPNALALAELARKAGLHPREMLRKKESVFAELGRTLDEYGAAAAIAAMVEHPILMERPIVVRGERALIARPPERVEEILGPPARVIPIRRLRRPKKGPAPGNA